MRTKIGSKQRERERDFGFQSEGSFRMFGEYWRNHWTGVRAIVAITMESCEVITLFRGVYERHVFAQLP